MNYRVSLGATYLGQGICRFLVWAPLAENVAVRIISPEDRVEPLHRGEQGYHYGEINGVEPGARYFYLLDGRNERPDPASRYQPEDVHGPSQVVGSGHFAWSDGSWFGPAREDLIFYELHVGTYTPEGTFEAIIPRLNQLRELGITAIELMPVAQFPGNRNWGYDGVFPFAVQNSYGGPEGLRRLVDACHRSGLAVFIDVVYNHLGPEGNYLREFAPYFTDRYHTPWGEAFNFDGDFSDEVRRFFIENALYWITEFHMDGLRLDAIHAITDKSAFPFLEELAGTVHRLGERLGRRVFIIGESDLNDPRVIRPREVGGYGLDGQWSDDFHHALHSLLTGEKSGYYQDYGRLWHLARALQDSYVYTGQYSRYRGRRHGRRPVECEADKFVVFAQNHDQVGNRARGKRLGALTSFTGLKLAASVVFLSPFTPLLFMGEEYGETAPFQYFTSHSDAGLVKAVREGRREEFADFGWEEKLPDPQSEATFIRSRLNPDLLLEEPHCTLREFYRELIRLRRELPALADLDKNNMEVTAFDEEMVLLVRRRSGHDEVCIVFSFAEHRSSVALPLPAGLWRKWLDTAEERWLGSGGTVPAILESAGKVSIALGPRNCVLLERIKEA